MRPGQDSSALCRADCGSGRRVFCRRRFRVSAVRAYRRLWAWRFVSGSSGFWSERQESNLHDNRQDGENRRGFRRTSPRGKSEKPHKRAAEASFREVTAAGASPRRQFAPSYGNRRDPSSFGFGARACPGASAGLPECSVKRPVSVSGYGEVRIFAREIGSVRSS